MSDQNGSQLLPVIQSSLRKVYCAPVMEAFKAVPDESVQCCVTSPPFWGLRSYLPKGHPLKQFEIGQEKTPQEYVAGLVRVFNEVWRVLKKDGTLWLNLGDSYASNAGSAKVGKTVKSKRIERGSGRWGGGNNPAIGCKPKDLIGIPWMVAFALRDAGWYLRSDIIWAKPNCMPESVRDRPTRSHEYLFLLSKSRKYYYDADAIAEPAKESSVERLSQDVGSQTGSVRGNSGRKTNGAMRAVFGGRNKFSGIPNRLHSGREDNGSYILNGVNKRDVWTVAPASYREAHFATFPPKLIEPCILAGSRKGDCVLDPFAGSGTTGEVAIKNSRTTILIELNPEYIPLINKRTSIELQHELL